jgi:tRNA(Arg) A34 adenosine deaminase TadA
VNEFDLTCLRAAFAAAHRTKSAGNHPFGAVLVRDGTIMAEAENTVVTEGDPTCHAEMNLVRRAVGQWSREELGRCTLYASTEPCVMCCGAIYWAGIRHVVYGCSADALARHAGGSLAVPCRDTFERGRHSTIVEGPLLEAEGEALHDGAW